MSRGMSSPTSYTITVWAGPDMYTQIRMPVVPYRDDPSAEYQEVSNRLHDRMEDDFGKGAELVRRGTQEYDINVDKVAVEP